MTTVGEILIKARGVKKLSLEQVEKATHIRLKFLEAIEKNRFEDLPPGTFAKGFIKNYASYLGISTDEIMAFYRRQATEEKAKVLPERDKQLSVGRWGLTPQFFTTAAVGGMLLAFFGYLIFSYFTFAGAPSLTVVNPDDNTVVHQEQVEVSGKTDPDATLTINSQVVGLKESGDFDVKVPLGPGLNTLTIVATNKFKRQSSVSRNIRLEK